ncbi:putative zinc finger, CCHC-type containing protein [Tanacetum coccineum]
MIKNLTMLNHLNICSWLNQKMQNQQSSLMQKNMKNTRKTQTKRRPQSSQKLQYYTIDVVIKRFLTRLQGRLRDWCHSLGEYRQLHIQQSISPEAFMSIIYSEFIGSPWEHTSYAREEFLKMKCCSFQKKDLEKHYDRINEAYRALEARNVTISQTTLGELYQLILNALEKLCNQKKFLAEFERTGKCLGTACDDKYLQIKCKDKSSCDCHFARNCPDKKRSQALIQALNQVEPVDVSDVESLYSLDDEPSESVLCTIAYSDFSSDDDSDTDSLESDSNFGVHMINPIPHVLPIQEDPPLPLAKVHLLTDAYAKPILVIAFFNTGSSVSILNPNILLDHYWKPHHQNFMAANGEKFSYAELLSKFYSLVTKYRIMLSEKKMEVGMTTIQFLGMEISDGKYQPQPHVAQELLKFPDELSSQKMIQQFLGLVNYMADFLPKLSHHTALLFPMLKKESPTVDIKCLAEKMPPLKIPASAEKRILQTDASDECWGAVLLVQDNNNKRHVCGYKSGTFKASEQHYHSTFKETLAFKRKMLPHAQLLRWSNWFSQWKFTVKHIKGTENVLADFLSRPKAYKLEENYPKDASRVQKHTPHFLSMVFSVTSHKEEGSSSNPTPTIPVFDLPEEIVETIGDLTFEKRAKLCYKTFLTILLKNHGLCVKGLRFHPDYPFLNIFHIHDLWKFPKEALCFFYYLFESFTIGITFNAEKLLSYVVKSQFKDVPPTLNIYLLCYNGSFITPKVKLMMMDQFVLPPILLYVMTVETSDDDDDARSLWSSDDDEHFDPFEDDPTHPDARWSP